MWPAGDRDLARELDLVVALYRIRLVGAVALSRRRAAASACWRQCWFCIATDPFHAFGSPEVRHLTPDGRLRIRYFHGDQRQLREWAERRGVEVTEETIAGE